jgi:hypothetical protein
MHFSKRNALAMATALCSALLYVGAISASAATTNGVTPDTTATVSGDAAYKAATDTNPVPPLTPDEQKTLDQKRQEATNLLSGTASTATVRANSSAASASSTSASGSIALSQDQNPQKTKYYCGPASVREALGQMGQWFTQDQLAGELGTTTAGTGWLNGSSGPVPRVLNAHQSRRSYFGTPVSSSPSSGEINYFKLGLATNIPLLGVPLIGDAYEVKGGPHLAGHPNRAEPIFHWFDIYGYTNSGNYTKYEDSVHGVSTSIISWASSVPAYSSILTSKIVQIVGGRGYVW